MVAGGARDLEGCKSLKRLKPGNGKLECLRWSQAPPLPWRRPGSADIFLKGCEEMQNEN